MRKLVLYVAPATCRLSRGHPALASAAEILVVCELLRGKTYSVPYLNPRWSCSAMIALTANAIAAVTIRS
jgi:hypothetical protein